MADLVADSPTIINHIVDVFKLAGATGGVIWYLSHRLTKTENNVEKLDLKLSGEIGKLDGKLDKMDIKIAGEIRDVNHKIESKIELIDVKLKNMSDSSDKKYDELEKQLTHYQDEVDEKIEKIAMEVKANGSREIVIEKPVRRKRVATSKIQKA